MGLSPILYIIPTITVGTMLNFNHDDNGHGIKNVTSENNDRIFVSRLS